MLARLAIVCVVAVVVQDEVVEKGCKVTTRKARRNWISFTTTAEDRGTAGEYCTGLVGLGLGLVGRFRFGGVFRSLAV